MKRWGGPRQEKEARLNDQDQISLIIEIVKLITAIISLIGVLLPFLKEIGFILSLSLSHLYYMQKEIENNRKIFSPFTGVQFKMRSLLYVAVYKRH